MNEESVFAAALERKTPAERAAYLDRACGDDAELRRRVEALLEAHFEPGRFLDPAAAPPEATAAPEVGPTVARPVAEGPGALVGPYKLLQKIGEGGMGAVYMAEQEHPVRRRVALKIIKPGMDSAQVVARFEAERQALAMMDHQNIARVLDAGTTDTGRPYFVMELVRGVPITEYCDQNHLTPRERLELFVPICQAIQHAHQKGIIHRDVKPSNVLVTLYDGKPVPKVIDFGVAKAIDQRLTERTMFTQFGMIVGTLEYMSPEQAALSGLDIDTRSDIYSLGVLLYELLTGSTPLEKAKLRRAAYSEILRRIREEEPPKPSTRLSESKDALPTISARRKTEPSRLSRLVRGELDWIVMKALEKDRTRRYETANGFARDVQRYLQDEPIEACPPSSAYRLRKFVHRYRAPLATAAAFAAILVLGAILSAWQAVRATRAERAAREAAERARTEAAISRAVNDFLREDLLAEAAPARNPRERRVTVEEVVRRAARKVAGRFEGRPLIEASIRRTIGQTLRALGLFDEARDQLERAAELLRRAEGAEHPDTLGARNDLAGALAAGGHRTEAEALFAEVEATGRRALGVAHPVTLVAMRERAMRVLSRSRSAEAEADLARVVDDFRRTLGAGHPETIEAIIGLALVYQHGGKLDEAESLIERALDAARRGLGAEHPVTLNLEHNLAILYQERGKRDEAEPLLVAALEAQRRVLGDEHPATLTAMSNLGMFHLAQGRRDEGEALLRRGLELAGRAGGDGDPGAIVLMNGLAGVCLERGRFDEAEALFTRALRASRRLLGTEDPETIVLMGNLASLDQALGKLAEAEALQAQAHEELRRIFGEESAQTLVSAINLACIELDRGKLAQAEALLRTVIEADMRVEGRSFPWLVEALSALGMVLLERERAAEAEPLLREALAIREAEQPDSWTQFFARSLLGASLLGQREFAEAEPLLLSGYEGMKAREAKIPAPARVRLSEAGTRVVALYEAWGKPEKAAEWRARLGETAGAGKLPTRPFARP